MMRTKALICLVAAILGGCTVGPDYVRPKVGGTAGLWLAPVSLEAVDPQWWRALGDAQLDKLVADALAHNLDLRIAEARLQEARAISRAARGKTAPQLNATGSAAEQQVSENGLLPAKNIPGFQRRYSMFDAGLDASWELDLWGGVARSLQASDARAQATAIRAEDTRLRIIAEVVRTYVDLRNAQARGGLLSQEARLRDEIAGLMDQRFKGGESSRSDAENTHLRADNARAQLPESDASAHASAYSLALLTGRPPEALVKMAMTTAPLPLPPAIAGAGIRSELLQRRPDVRAAEADLVAATADIGVETANLYPRFSLTASVGQQARSVADLANSASTRFAIGPSFSWPIFSFGRIRAQIRAANARADASAAAYEKAILGALTDSETAANRFASSLIARISRERALGRARVAEQLAEQRFQRGEDDRIQMLEARSAALQAEQLALAANADAATAYVNFTKALGGGAMPTGMPQ
jgi:NodT family efflux transporter outer membrane factor (OMF) lipoprotein